VNVIVDGVIYGYQSKGGIPRIFTEILPRMCDMEEGLSISLLLFNTPKGDLPTHPRIIENRMYLPNLPPTLNSKAHKIIRYTTKISARVSLGDTHKKIWHSTYYSSLPKWDGPYVVTLHDLIYELHPNLFPDSNVIIPQKYKELSRADIILCDSNSTKQDLMELYRFPEDKIKIVYPGYNPVFILQSPIKEDLNKKFFLYVGSRAQYKGFEDLLRGYSQSPSRHKLKLLINELGISEEIELQSEISDQELCDLYNRALAFVYPSWREGFGIPLLEAMACGCPIIASRIPSTLEVAGEIPHYFEPGSPDTLAVTLDRVATESPESSRKLAGLERVKRFSWDKTAQETLDVYRSLLSAQ
jgi:glycosyltransferase involved in cell wall biosynthesis